MYKKLIFFLFCRIIFGNNCVGFGDFPKEKIESYVLEKTQIQKVEIVRGKAKVCSMEKYDIKIVGNIDDIDKKENIDVKYNDIIEKIIIYPEYIETLKKIENKTEKIQKKDLRNFKNYKKILDKIEEINDKLFYLNIYLSTFKYSQLFENKEYINYFDYSMPTYKEIESEFLTISNGNEYYIFDLSKYQNKLSVKNIENEIFQKILNSRNYIPSEFEEDFNIIKIKDKNKYPTAEEIDQIYINLENDILELKKIIENL